MTRSGAAARLDMEAAAAALPDGLSSACLARDASFDMGAFDQDVPAQNVPGSVAEVGKECETGESSKTTLLHVSDWSLDDWLTSHRRPEDLPGVEVDKISGVPCYKDPNSGVIRDARYLLPSSVMPVKVGLMKVVQLKEWKKGSLHEQMLELKGLGRTLSQEYKKVDVVRPYAKAGPLVAASVHPGTYHIILAPSVK